MTDEFSQEQKAGLYKAIFERRDMRHFAVGGTVEEGVLERLLTAAHAAPSVGLMQPWRFIRIVSTDTRKALHQLVEKERVATAHALGEREDEFMKLKVQGVLDSAEVLVVGLMAHREQHIFGRRTMPEMDLASASCAIQNMWLAARAEGLGMGWVSIFDPDELRQALGMPKDSSPIAILCLGPVDHFYDEPMLIKEGWAKRGKLEDYLMEDGWDVDKASAAQKQWDEK